MIQRMLRVDNWLDVAPLANVEGDHSFLFMKKILMKIFFFFGKIWKSWIFFMELKILIDDFFFFFEKFGNLEFFQGIENFDWFFFFFFLKYEDCSLSKSEEDEDEDVVKAMKIYSWWFFFFFFLEKPILWMRISLAGSWCGLLDKSLLNSCKKIISISNGFIHWNELEVLTQCP